MKTIGMTTTYQGTEHAYLNGLKVRILGVIRRGAAEDFNPEAPDTYLKSEYTIDQVGGVSAEDRLEVQPWLKDEGRYSWVTSDPKAVDLKCYAHLKTAK